MPAPRCPACAGAMRALVVEGVEVDLCPACRGLWLDRGELERLGLPLPAHRPDGGGPARACPRCASRMDRRDARGARAELCWGCGGVFLDAAQLRELARLSGSRPLALRLPEEEAPGGLEAPPLEEERAEVFWCELCRRPTPRAEQVVAERLTVCPACAERQGLRHEPRARRKAEAENERANRTGPPDDTRLILYSLLRMILPF